MTSPPRHYKRYSTDTWNAHRDTIRDLVVGQGKKYDEIAAILKDEHGSDIGYGSRFCQHRSTSLSIPASFPLP
jgi:hypothetical protein